MKQQARNHRTHQLRIETLKEKKLQGTIKQKETAAI
jgi:hypothetical protein